MIGNMRGQGNAISASWQRCAHDHGLEQHTAQPILRLRSNEIAPRREELVERTGGRLGVFKQVSRITAASGQCFVIADPDGILVRREVRSAQQSEFENNGIAAGSCWDEPIAGTNGVSMALRLDRPFTVRGPDHYFTAFNGFACTGVRLLDADNNMIGVTNIATVDRGRPADYLFAQQLLEVAADRIQNILFQRHFRDSMIVSMSSPANESMLGSHQLIAIDEAGIILGSTRYAHHLVGLASPAALKGQPFDAVFGADAELLDRMPERGLSVHRDDRPALHLSRALPSARSSTGRGWQPRGPGPKRRRLSPSLRELAIGSSCMVTQGLSADAGFQRGIPFLIEGESGTGKSALISALHRSADLPHAALATVDCALLSDDEQDRGYVRTLIAQARAGELLQGAERRAATLVLDNVDELPAFAQAALRHLLSDIEADGGTLHDDAGTGGLRLLATARRPVREAVRNGRFRDDLYFLLANIVIELPPLRIREKRGALARALAARLAGFDVEITPEAMQALLDHDWPGNVRELRSVLQQALNEGDGRRISLLDLQASAMLRGQAAGPSGPPRSIQAPAYDERTRLLDALARTRWNVSQAARHLGIGRATMHRKMNKHGVSRPT